MDWYIPLKHLDGPCAEDLLQCRVWDVALEVKLKGGRAGERVCISGRVCVHVCVRVSVFGLHQVWSTLELGDYLHEI